MKNPFKREPDLTIGSVDDPYLLRWFMLPKNKLFNVYLHKFMRSDDDRALHDHPWMFNVSILLTGSYTEQKPAHPKEWPHNLERQSLRRKRFIPYIRWGKAPHRVELDGFLLKAEYRAEIPVWTIFITGPRVRDWGFYCRKGWVWWRDYTSNTPGRSEVGKGCGDE